MPYLSTNNSFAGMKFHSLHVPFSHFFSEMFHSTLKDN